MDNQIIKTKIALKQNTYQYWTEGAGKDYIPLYGEICCCEIKTLDDCPYPNTMYAPSVLFKVGLAKLRQDGTYVQGTDIKFQDLTWACAPAADVYAWAKLSWEEFCKKLTDLGIVNNAEINISNTDGKINITNGVFTLNQAGNQTITIGHATKPETGNNVKDAADKHFITNIQIDEYGHIADFSSERVEQPSLEVSEAEYAVGEAETVEVTQDIEVDEQNNHKLLEKKVQVVTPTGLNNSIDEINVFTTDQLIVSNIGDIKVGDDLNGKTTHEILKKLLYPYLSPVINSISRSPSGTTYEIGNNQTITSVSLEVLKKSEQIKKVELYNGNTLLAEKTGEEVAITGVGSNAKKTYVFSGLNIPVNSTNVVLTAKVSDTEVINGNKTAVTKNTANWTFVYPYYYGKCASDAVVDENLVKSLTKSVVSERTNTIGFKFDYEKMVYAFPKSYGALKSILDPNGFEIIASFERKEISITNEYNKTTTYYVYVNQPSTTDDVFNIKFVNG